MGTRSDIIVHRADGTWKRIYCHWDGYLDGVGKTPFEHYNTQKKAEALVALGDLSALGKRIGKKHPFDAPSACVGTDYSKTNPAYEAYRKKYEGMCLAYGRDRGEKDVDGVVGDSLDAVWPASHSWTEFTYVWNDGAWGVCTGDHTETKTLVSLEKALAGQEPVTPLVKSPIGVLGRHQAK
jgi:hypothetical protein